MLNAHALGSPSTGSCRAIFCLNSALCDCRSFAALRMTLSRAPNGERMKWSVRSTLHFNLFLSSWRCCHPERSEGSLCSSSNSDLSAASFRDSYWWISLFQINLRYDLLFIWDFHWLFHHCVLVSDMNLLRTAILSQRTSWNLGLNWPEAHVRTHPNEMKTA